MCKKREKGRFKELRPTMLDGDLILFSGSRPGSWLIRRETHSDFSHVGLVAWWDDRLMVLEAKHPGVVASRLRHVVELYHGQAVLWRVGGGEKANRRAVVEAAREELGKRYATWRIFQIWRRLRFGIIRREYDPWKPCEKFVCSDFVYRSWLHGGLDLVPGRKGIPTPEELRNSPYLTHEEGAL